VGDRGYANGHTDTGSGLVQLGARAYDPASGAFTEPDPVLDPTNPAQMHGVYAYAWNNPLTFTDPTGTEPYPHHAKGASISASKNYKPYGYDNNQYADYKRGKPPHVSATKVSKHESTRATNKSAANSSSTGRRDPNPSPTSSSRIPPGGAQLVPAPQPSPGPTLGSPPYRGPTEYLVWKDPTPYLAYDFLLGDYVNCAQQDAEACAWAAAGFVPYGKFARLAKPVRAATDTAGEARALLGNSDDVVVLGRQPDTAVAEGWDGHVVLNTPKWSLELNDEFIQGAIEQRRLIYLASPTKGNLVQTSGQYAGQPTIFARELNMLRQAGYTRVGDYLVPPS
jgi:RHS repeat-associated protein